MKATPIEPTWTPPQQAERPNPYIDRLRIIDPNAARLLANHKEYTNAVAEMTEAARKQREQQFFLARVRKEAEDNLQARIAHMNRAPSAVLDYRNSVLTIEGQSVYSLASAKYVPSDSVIYGAIKDANECGFGSSFVAMAWGLHPDELNDAETLRKSLRGDAMVFRGKARYMCERDRANPEYAAAYIQAVQDCGELHPLPTYQIRKDNNHVQQYLFDRVVRVGKRIVEQVPTIDRRYTLYRMNIFTRTAGVLIEKAIWGDVTTAPVGNETQDAEQGKKVGG